MLKTASTTAVAASVALALTACSAGGASTASSAAADTHESTVPAGVAHQYATIAEEVAAEGGEATKGAWRVAYIVEPAEPWYVTTAGKQVRRDPAPGETHHIEILPFENASGRLVPEVPVRLEVLDGDGKLVDAEELDMLSGEFFHYASNFSVPVAGSYTLRATLGTPTFLRHGDSEKDLILTHGVTIEFPDVILRSEGEGASR